MDGETSPMQAFLDALKKEAGALSETHTKEHPEDPISKFRFTDETISDFAELFIRWRRRDHLELELVIRVRAHSDRLFRQRYHIRSLAGHRRRYARKVEWELFQQIHVGQEITPDDSSKVFLHFAELFYRVMEATAPKPIAEGK